MNQKVVVSDINIEAAKATVEEIKAIGGDTIAVMTNVAREEDIQNLINTAVDTYGTVDILVNNAGIMDNFEPAGEIIDWVDVKWTQAFLVHRDRYSVPCDYYLFFIIFL
ncbi:SDR family NAD(P)-dependent oxidoreductase [Bacillus sp. 1P02SD]|uniref:SDR family NAD(P)-dependent oxidoreductase n=1 Tax=Bacillus sp. 1P02SD TaxID=3132264 RepID=UPI0039A32D46